MAGSTEVIVARETPAPQAGVAQLAKALVSAQGDIKSPRFDAQSTAYGNKPYKYASLASVMDAVRLPLAKHGLTVLQLVENEGGDLIVRTRLMHASGEFIEASQRAQCPLKPQDRGGVTTYLRRYGLNAILGLAAEEDDDAAGAQEHASQGEKRSSAGKRSIHAPAAPTPDTTERAAPPVSQPQRRDNLADEGSETFTAVEATVGATGQGKFGPWELIVLKTAEGPSFSTLKAEMGQQLRDAAEDAARVRITWARTKKGGLECKAIERMAEDAP